MGYWSMKNLTISYVRDRARLSTHARTHAYTRSVRKTLRKPSSSLICSGFIGRNSVDSHTCTGA
jgi:hypothetical protein